MKDTSNPGKGVVSEMLNTPMAIGTKDFGKMI
jgi:hypothetical protein